jgi:SAM-dependent methyltransferase
MVNHLSEIERYQEQIFDQKAGKAKFYSIGGRNNRNHAIKIKKILQTLKLIDGNNVLEVGLGEGEHAATCLNYCNIHLTGIDISQKALDEAEKRLQPFFQGRYELKKENANNLSFEDNFFDAVFCGATLHHMEKPYRMISEMVRVLKFGGRLAIMEPNWIYPTNIGFMLMLKEDRNMWLMRKKNFIKWMERAGMSEINIEYLLYTPPAPKFMIPFYSVIDTVCSKLPIINRCSLMLFGSGVK